MTTPSGEYRIIPLTQGQVAIVDAADYESLMRWKWQAKWEPTHEILLRRPWEK